MFKRWCEWGISSLNVYSTVKFQIRALEFIYRLLLVARQFSKPLIRIASLGGL